MKHHSAQETWSNMAKLSWMAYQKPEDVGKTWRERSALAADGNWSPLKAASEPPQYATCPSCDAQAYAFKMGACPRAPLVLACRGTSSIQDAMVDVSLQLVPFKFADGTCKEKVLVHRGFYEQFKGILPQVDTLYEGHLAGGGMLACTGHSLGAGVATLAALYYGEQYPGQVAYVGFGSPRVGNAAFAESFDATVLDRTRVVNGRDPGETTRLQRPTSLSFESFEHVFFCVQSPRYPRPSATCTSERRLTSADPTHTPRSPR